MGESRRVRATDAAIGARVNQIAWAKRATRVELAHALGLQRGAAVSRKLRGTVGWTAADLILASQFLRVPVGDLLAGPELVECAIRDSNPEPADFSSFLVRGGEFHPVDHSIGQKHAA